VGEEGGEVGSILTAPLLWAYCL